MTESLHRKYRPKSFEEVVGNESMLESLKSVLDREEGVPSTFLFHGPSGCGKTTIARIVAYKELGFSDVVELNISNQRGIKHARDIIENIQYAPLHGSGKVLVLNECHKATNEFQNAMLEALEEPPAKVHFILCTTEPNKLLKTILTRCFRYEVKPLLRREIKTLLSNVYTEEVGEEPDDFMNEVFDKISKVCDGCPREALVFLDSVIDVGDDEKIEEVMGRIYISESSVKELCQALLNKKGWKTVSGILEGLRDSDPESVRYAVLGYMNSVLLNSDNERAGDIIALFLDSFIEQGMAGLTYACYIASKV